MPSVTPIIFLDFDGVLNSVASMYSIGDPSKYWSNVSIGLIALLAERGDAEIVVSSAWRLHHPDAASIQVELRSMKAAQIAKYVVGKTDHDGPVRGAEIARWLAANGDPPYLIIDDSADMLDGQLSRFVRVQGNDGFCFRHYCRAMAILCPQRIDWQLQEQINWEDKLFEAEE